MFGEKFQIYSVKITANTFVSRKIESPRQMGIAHFYQTAFFEDIFFWEARRERIMELKKLPKLTKVSVTSFDKFHHLCNLYIFGLCFVVQ